MKPLAIAVGAVLATSVATLTSADAREASGFAREESRDEQKSDAPSMAPADLDAQLAPIALYPDSLLAPILLCASNPARVPALSEWLRSQDMPNSELQDAAIRSGFDESCAALVLFPDVVNMMAERSDWTARVGQAFASDRGAVFDSIQRLRAQAKAAGSLKTTPQQDVETRKTSSGEQVIVIEPANPQVVYVPQYDPQVVYTQTAPTTVVVEDDDDDAEAAVAGLIGFTAGIAIGAAIDNDYYYGPYGWHGGYMYNDAWDDWYDAREDAREDWQDHREDMVDERGERAGTQQEQRTERQQTAQQERTERQQTRQENRPTTQAEREDRRASAQSAAPQTATRSASGQESRGYSGNTRTTGERSGTSSSAFSGYSSGRSERAASSRGQRSRSSSRSGGRRR
jgi:hypothetical protein